MSKISIKITVKYKWWTNFVVWPCALFVAICPSEKINNKITSITANLIAKHAVVILSGSNDV